MTNAIEEVLAVIIGRAGSKGLPRKNALMVADAPMIAHTIRFARASSTIDRVIVSTDGDEIAQIAADEGVEVFMRPESVSHDTATVDSAVRHAVTASGSRAEIVVILYANVPVRPANLADRAIAQLRESLFAVDEAQPHAFFGRDRRGIETNEGDVIDVDSALDLAVAHATLRAREDVNA